MSSTTQWEIERIDAEKQKIQRAEFERQQKELAPQRAIAALEAEKRAILEDARFAEINAIKRENDAAVDRVFSLHQELIAALEAGDVHLAIAKGEQADEAWRAHRAILKAAVGMMTSDFFVDHDLYALAQRYQLRQAWNWGSAVLQWIAESPDPVTRRIRQGFGWGMGIEYNGRVVDASPNYSAADAYRQANTGGLR